LSERPLTVESKKSIEIYLCQYAGGSIQVEKTTHPGGNGKVAEWLKALLSKSSEGQLSESSNLSLSAIQQRSLGERAGPDPESRGDNFG
jgi:hypothetical protein